MEKGGIFERANGGTLFLDEINSMPIGLQAKLLRAVQENKIRRVGALNEIPINIKIISASNMEPHQAIESGCLRQDLLYRLGVVFIRIPPLREHLDDLSLLTSHFIEKLNDHLGKKVLGISDEVLEKFKEYPWPGNVRELEHVIEGAMNMVQSNESIGLRHILFSMSFHMSYEFLKPKTAMGSAENSDALVPTEGEQLKTTVSKEQASFPEQGLTRLQAEQEEGIIRKALTGTAGNVTRAARKLGLSPQLLSHKMKKYGIKRGDFLP